MKVVFNQSLCGPECNFHAGEEVDLESSDAIRLIEAGIATPVRAEKAEIKIIKAAEKAAK
jgi:hypothetical protein